MDQGQIARMLEDHGEAVACLKGQEILMFKAAQVILKSLQEGGRVLTLGNGSSAADAQDIAAALVGRFLRERRGLAALALTTNTSFLTAWPNDYEHGFQTIFERQVQALAKPNDVLWALSTSGDSDNLVRAFKAGRAKGTFNLSFTGGGGGKLKDLSDLNITIPGENKSRIQEAHELAYHIICALVDSEA